MTQNCKALHTQRWHAYVLVLCYATHGCTAKPRSNCNGTLNKQAAVPHSTLRPTCVQAAAATLAVGKLSNCSSNAEFTASIKALDVVTRIGRAAASCSACASKSAAIVYAPKHEYKAWRYRPRTRKYMRGKVGNPQDAPGDRRVHLPTPNTRMVRQACQSHTCQQPAIWQQLPTYRW